MALKFHTQICVCRICDAKGTWSQLWNQITDTYQGIKSHYIIKESKEHINITDETSSKNPCVDNKVEHECVSNYHLMVQPSTFYR